MKYNVTFTKFDELGSEIERSEKVIIDEQNIGLSIRNSTYFDVELGEIINLLQQSDEIIKLGSIIDVSIGYQLYHNTIHKPEEISERVFHSKTKIDDNWIREITSKDLRRFKITFKTASYVNKTAQFFRIPPKRFLESNKLLLREVISKDGFVIALVKDEVFFPKTILSIILRVQNTNERLLALLGYLISYVCQFDFMVNGIKASRKYFPRISVQSLKNLNFTEKIFSRDIETFVQNLIHYSDSEEERKEFNNNFVQFQARIFTIWNISPNIASLIMNYLKISSIIQEQILPLIQLEL